MFLDRAQKLFFSAAESMTMSKAAISTYIFNLPIKTIYRRKIAFLVQLKTAIGDQKIDVVISRDRSRLIEQEAIKTGIEL